MDYLFLPGSPFPEATFQKIKLPAINGREARLSGACTLNDRQILFSASVEDTPDWTKDGPVLGSFIGSYNINRKTVDACYLLQDVTGKPMKEKIESLDILHSQESEAISIVAVSDDDNGISKLFRLRILK